MHEVFKTDPHDRGQDDMTYMDYTAKLEELVGLGYKIISHEFTRLDGYNGLWVIIASKA